MPIYPLQRSGEYYSRTGEVLHVGCVIRKHSYEQRVMSDDWSTTHVAIVWDPAAKEPITIPLYTIGYSCSNECEIDLAPEYKADVDAFYEAARVRSEQAAYARRCEEAHKRLLEPRVGFQARVISGRKVKIGTVGIITWSDPQGAYGPRVGIKDASGTVQYTAASNVERVVEKLDGEDWLAVERRLHVEPVYKWDRVSTADGIEGTVFFLKAEKLGITTTNKKVAGRYVDVVWAYASTVTVLERRGGREPAFVDATPARPPVEAPF